MYFLILCIVFLSACTQTMTDESLRPLETNEQIWMMDCLEQHALQCRDQVCMYEEELWRWCQEQ